MYSLKNKSGRTMTNHAKSEPKAIRKAWEYFGCGWLGIPGKEPVYRFYGKWSSIIDDMIFYHWSINHVASQFHPIKIMIFHWQRIDETNQSTRRWSFRLTSGSRSDDYINLDDETVLCMSSSLKEKCQLHASAAPNHQKNVPSTRPILQGG